MRILSPAAGEVSMKETLMRRRLLLSFAFTSILVTALSARAWAQHGPVAAPDAAPRTPEERMARRFPQPVKVGFLVGLPVLDERSGTVARVEQVVRSPKGQIRLIVRHGGILGYGTRPVALPVEVVAMLGAHVAAVDMPAAEMARLPDWVRGEEEALPPDAVIRVALTRR